MSKRKDEQPMEPLKPQSTELSDTEFETQFSTGEPPSEVIIEALAAIEGTEPTALDPLYESIDPEALDALFGQPSIGEEEPDIVTAITVSGYRVIVASTGRISILEVEDED